MMTTILLAIIAWVAISIMVSPLLARIIATAADPEIYPFTDTLGGPNAQPAAEDGTHPVEASDYPRSASRVRPNPPTPSPPRRW